jgi:hypothetical protein
MASMHSDFFQGQTDRGLFYWAGLYGETWLPNLEAEVVHVKIFIKFATDMSKIENVLKITSEKKDF